MLALQSVHLYKYSKVPNVCIGIDNKLTDI